MHPMFLCDEMVAVLGRWLRAAGYDTFIPAPGASDRHIVERAVADGRTILTRDSAMGERRAAAGRILSLQGDDLEQWAAQVTQALAVDWLRHPFSRCLVCNLELRPHPDAAAAVPPNVRAEAGKIMHCPQCDKAYWRGSHTRRMHERLIRWHEGRFADGTKGALTRFPCNERASRGGDGDA